MSPKMVQEREHFSQSVSRTVNPNQLILPARPERDSLFLSVQLIAGDPVYVLGPSPTNGIVINLSASMPSFLACRDELGDVVGQSLWNGGTTFLQVVLLEKWSKPTGRCVCDDEE